MIAFNQVSKSFAGKAAVSDLTFTLNKGEFTVLIGTSGSGKSTTLKMINRLIEHDAGTITFAGEEIRQIDAQQLRRRMGYAIQSIGLFPHWTVARNIATVPALLNWPRQQIRARVEELLALLNLDASFASRYPHQLSGGQQQRVGVARALAADPELLLMDEPFGALDPVTRAALQDEILDQAAHVVFREGGDDGGALAEATAQATSDVVFAAAFPSGELAGGANPAVTGIETEHDFTQRDDVELAGSGGAERERHGSEK